MRLPVRAEVLFNPQVDLQATTSEPAPTTSRQHRRLLELCHAENVSPELAADVLSTWRDRKLHVMQAVQGVSERSQSHNFSSTNES
jgi:hypothetical protein